MIRMLWRTLLALAVALDALLALSPPAHAESAGWLLKCTFAKSLPDDPIVHPRMTGMSHLHDFFGNTSVNAASTYKSMIAAATSCPAGDKASYWLPAVFRAGTKVDPAGDRVREQIYFRANNLAAGTHIEAFPPDLRMIAGNSQAGSPSQNPELGHEIYWGCSDNSVGGKSTAPPASCRTGIITLHVGFPNCWDGTLTHANDTPHLQYPHSGRCPAGFPHALPRLIVRTEYPVGVTTGTITLASGPSFTAHGDFWNTWDQAKLQSFVDNCLNAGKNCGSFSGSGAGTVVAGSTATSGSSATMQHGATMTAPVSSSSQVPTSPASVAGGSGAVSSSKTSLPTTGGRSDRLLPLGIGLVCLGIAVLVGTRRQRRPRPRH
jgi:Domain of unknown function (DUF1996)